MPSAPSVGVPDSVTLFAPRESVIAMLPTANVEKSAVSSKTRTKVGESPLRFRVSEDIAGAVESALSTVSP